MTTKTAPKQDRPQLDETRLAYETHTLAQMLFRQLAVSHPWTATPFSQRVQDPVMSHNLGAPPNQMLWGSWGQPGMWG